MAGYTERDWSCLRKRRYEKVEDAAIEADRLNESPKHFGHFHVYFCKWCGNWHVGREKGKRYA